MEIGLKKISNIYDYISEETSPLQKADGAFVFLRWDPLVASRTAELFQEGLIDYSMLTGGKGANKDSGEFLRRYELEEAKWQGALLYNVHRIPLDKMFLELKATNGGECCRFGIDTIVDNNLPHDNLIVVCHPTSLKRVTATLEVEAEKKQFYSKFQRTGTKYLFNPENPVDQQESVAELLRLADWPAKNWCKKQEDLPLDLVEYAREIKPLFN